MLKWVSAALYIPYVFSFSCLHRKHQCFLSYFVHHVLCDGFEFVSSHFHIMSPIARSVRTRAPNFNSLGRRPSSQPPRTILRTERPLRGFVLDPRVDVSSRRAPFHMVTWVWIPCRGITGPAGVRSSFIVQDAIYKVSLPLPFPSFPSPPKTT